eukprot:RCo045454
MDVECPVCGGRFSAATIVNHVDQCLCESSAGCSASAQHSNESEPIDVDAETCGLEQRDSCARCGRFSGGSIVPMRSCAHAVCEACVLEMGRDSSSSSTPYCHSWKCPMCGSALLADDFVTLIAREALTVARQGSLLGRCLAAGRGSGGSGSSSSRPRRGSRQERAKTSADGVGKAVSEVQGRGVFDIVTDLAVAAECRNSWDPKPAKKLDSRAQVLSPQDYRQKCRGSLMPKGTGYGGQVGKKRARASSSSSARSTRAEGAMECLLGELCNFLHGCRDSSLGVVFADYALLLASCFVDVLLLLMRSWSPIEGNPNLTTMVCEILLQLCRGGPALLLLLPSPTIELQDLEDPPMPATSALPSPSPPGSVSTLSGELARMAEQASAFLTHREIIEGRDQDEELEAILPVMIQVQHTGATVSSKLTEYSSYLLSLRGPAVEPA